MPTSEVSLTTNGSPKSTAPPSGTCPAAPGLLMRTFGVEFDLLDGRSGELLHHAADQPTYRGSIRGELCREVARRRTAEILQEEEPLLVLAAPLVDQEEVEQVAVAVFVSRVIAPNESLAAVAQSLGLNPQTIDAWARRQDPWNPKVLRRVGRLITEQLASECQAKRLRQVSDNLSSQLNHTYEEISLLYRLTQNLKISASDEDLARLTLGWLADVLPARGVAIQLVATADAGDSQSTGRRESTLLTLGDCPLGSESFERLIARVNPQATERSVVIIGPATNQPDWPFPEVRQLIAVPLAEGDNLFGWLAAFNHVDDGQFSNIEASLMRSVGTILGIHGSNTNLYRHQSELLAGVVKALTSAIDAKDPYTCGHSDRVARVAVRLARQLGCDDKTIDTLYLSGLLHDIGKIGIDDNVLRKPGKLTDEEYEHIKRHVEIGHKILMDLKKLDDVLPVVLHHHESWDGSGYPKHLPAEEIPLSARIVGVADAFDAMSSDRPYRKGMPDDKIDGIFRAGAGKQWDPKVVDAFFSAREDLRQISRGVQDDTEFGPFKVENGKRETEV